MKDESEGWGINNNKNNGVPFRPVDLGPRGLLLMPGSIIGVFLRKCEGVRCLHITPEINIDIEHRTKRQIPPMGQNETKWDTLRRIRLCL